VVAVLGSALKAAPEGWGAVLPVRQRASAHDFVRPDLGRHFQGGFVARRLRVKPWTVIYNRFAIKPDGSKPIMRNTRNSSGQRSRANPLRISALAGKELPVALGDDFDIAVGHFYGGLIVKRVHRHWYCGGQSL
jgi:hypothetical protein